MEIVHEQLENRLERAVGRAVFTNVFRQRLDSSGLRELYGERVWQGFPLSGTDAIEIPDDELSQLVSALSPLIDRFISPDTGEVGNGLYFLTGSSASPRLPSIEGYAKMLVLASARIGSQRVSEMLAGWIEGQPITLWSCYLLKGAITDGELNPADGLHMSTLSRNHSEFPRSLAAQIDEHDFRNEQYARRAMLSFEHETAPAFYVPGDEPSDSSVFLPPREICNPELRSVSVHGLCRALSLEVNGNVDWFRQWWDYGDTYAFFLSPGGSHSHRDIGDSSPVDVSAQQLTESLELHKQLDEFTKMDLGIARWRRSKQARTPEERLVELRIAMEAVLLTDDSDPVGEKTHRLAMRGAWLLGDSLEERKEHMRNLQRAYRLASKVLHAGSLNSENEADDLAAISEAQNICRNAILQMARRRAIPDWTSVVLGEGTHRGPESHTA